MVKLHTDGRGLWSNVAKAVGLRYFDLAYIAYSDRVADFGEVRVYFDRRTWNTNKCGLIYTDALWLREFRAHLKTCGYSKSASNDVDYSEQGMQGDDYVSLDCGGKFIKEWKSI